RLDPSVGSVVHSGSMTAVPFTMTCTIVRTARARSPRGTLSASGAMDTSSRSFHTSPVETPPPGGGTGPVPGYAAALLTPGSTAPSASTSPVISVPAKGATCVENVAPSLVRRYATQNIASAAAPTDLPSVIWHPKRSRYAYPERCTKGSKG